MAGLLKRLRIIEKVSMIRADSLGTVILDKLLRPLRHQHSGPEFNWQSERVFYRHPCISPYDAPIFICVQSGDVNGTRELLSSGSASIDSIDPFGLGLLYVRKPLTPLLNEIADLP